MENKIIETIKTIFVALALGSALAVVGFAQKPDRFENNTDLQQSVREFGVQNKQSQNKIAPNGIGNLSVKEINASAVNQKTFNIGSEFAKVTVLTIMNEDGEVQDTLVSEMNTLINLLGTEPEAASLRRTLRSMTQGTANSEQVANAIETASDAYQERLNAEQDWYFTSGRTVIFLMVGTYLGNEQLTKKALADVQNLIRNAPTGTSAQVLSQMKNLVRFAGKTGYSQGDYNAIFQGAESIADSVNA